MIKLNYGFISNQWLIWVQNDVNNFTLHAIGDIKVCLDILSDHDFHANGNFDLVWEIMSFFLLAINFIWVGMHLVCNTIALCQGERLPFNCILSFAHKELLTFLLAVFMCC